jgi:amidophosphoribosyltransferase
MEKLMCGIVGLYLKNSDLEARFGELFEPMLVAMTDRGADSAGIAIYHNKAADGFAKITLYHPDRTFDWEVLCDHLRADLNATVRANAIDSHLVIETDADTGSVEVLVEDFDPDIQVMSAGAAIEIFKEMDTPQSVAERFALTSMSATHGVGHTRMATESAVTTAGSHPFSTGPDLCLVHNGSLSNHARLGRELTAHHGVKLRTRCDTEVAAAYVSHRMDNGQTLHQALDDCLGALDGFYTFVAGTRDGFAVLRDPIACKPAVLAETEDYVAFASEYRAFVGLPGIETARVWEPEPAVVYSWGGQA